MIWENLKDTLVQTDLMAENEQEIFEQLGGVLVSEGCCKESYVSALSEREKVYPTGILAGDIGVAIPHTDPCYVETTGIAIGVLKEPVSFFQMGTNPKRLLAERGIPSVEISECKALEVVGRAEIFNPDVIIHTAEIPVNELKEYKTYRTLEFITGFGAEEKADEIADDLKSLE